MKAQHKSLLPITVLFLMAGTTAMAQTAVDAAAANSPAVPELFYNPAFYVLSFLFIILSATIVSLTRTIRVLAYSMLPEEEKNRRKEQVEKQKASEPQTSFWTRFDRAVLTRAVPVEKEEDVMLHHNYDGIRELDNSLPPWWVWGFYLTIFWSVVYLFHYHVMDTGALSEQEYRTEIASAEAEIKARQSKMANFVSAETVITLNTPEALGAGKETFIKNCVACHGQNGEGTVGPNLTDAYWIHGGGIKNVFKIITTGVPAKGMISWKAQLSPKEIQHVASYILSLQGTNPANGKAPEGDKWEDAAAAPQPSVQDSTKSNADSALVTQAVPAK
jgi:cytochrome c oxidase cbb3-type subunit 3